MMARYYEASLGRFLSVDVKSYQERNDKERAEFLRQPQSWNRYSYALNNPLKFTDPNGMIVENKATDQTTRQTANNALKYSPMVQGLNVDKNTTVTITNGPTKNILPKGKDNGAATTFLYDRDHGKLKITITIDPSVAKDKTAELTRTELGRAEQIKENPEGMTKAAAEDAQAKETDAQKKGNQIKEDVEKGQAAEAAKEKNP
jgi:RHS repeat-associated protein